MVDQIARDVEESVDQAVAAMARALAAERRLEREQHRNAEKIEDLQTKAERAVEDGAGMVRVSAGLVALERPLPDGRGSDWLGVRRGETRGRAGG